MKRILLNLVIAWRSLYNFKLRSALALLGIFLGTFSLILVSNLSAAFMQKTLTEINSFGENLLIVKSGIIRHFGARTRLLSEAANLTVDDAAAILNGSVFVGKVSPSSRKAFPVRYADKGLRAIPVVGVCPNYQETRKFYHSRGRFLSKEDNINLEKVILLGTSVAEKLFGFEDPLGKYVLVRRAPCRVIGIMEAKGSDVAGDDQDNQIFMPLNTFLRRFVNRNYIDTIYVQAVNQEAMPFAESEIELIMRSRHKIKKGERDDFTVIDLKTVMSLKTQAVQMITVLGSTASIISFLIGGIGILSIMILIVNERRVEIGIRRAVGSKKRDIIFQFLMESSIISLFGGIVGVGAGFVVCVIIFKFTSLPFNNSVSGLVFSFIASVTIGIFAGIYPSKKAVAIEPIDVIRS